MMRVFLQRHFGLHVPGECAAFPKVLAAHLVRTGVASWHPDDAPAVAVEPEPAVAAPAALEPDHAAELAA